MPRQVDHQARRQAICDAVLLAAVREGFGQVTIRRVAAEAGASTSVVTHYVAGREELLRLTVRREVARRQAQLEALLAGVRPEGRLRAVIEWSVLGLDETTHRAWLALVVGAQTEPVLRRELDGFNAWWDTLLARCIRQLGAPSGLPADTLVDAINVVVDGMIMARFEEAEPWPSPRHRRTLDALLRSILLPPGQDGEC